MPKILRYALLSERENCVDDHDGARDEDSPAWRAIAVQCNVVDQ